MGRGGDGEMGAYISVNLSLEPLMNLAFIRASIPLNPPKARGTLIASGSPRKQATVYTQL